MNEDRKIEMIQLREAGKTYQEIGNIFEISRQRVHQIVTGYNSKWVGVIALENLFELDEKINYDN